MTAPAGTNEGMPDTAAPVPPASAAPGGRDDAERSLRSLAGHDARLREDQWTAISALLDGRRALVVQRTGWGKSAVYFVATALLRARGAGPTVIVSPLLALMRNQIDAAGRAGIRARTINSANADDWEETYGEIAAGDVDVLLVSPERLNNPGFRDRVLPELAGTAGMLVIDEAHCISDWGHDFRPDYRRLRTLLASLPDGVPVLATTATANARVTRDVAEQLGAGGPGDAVVLRGPLDRESLHLSVVPLPTAHQRLAWLAEHIGDLPGSGIIYTLTVAAAQETAAFLRDQGLAVTAYSGRDDPEQRVAAEEDLLANRVKAIVATSALGMGFDKPDLGFVVHLGAPPSPVAYYQQIGRAGRGVPRAEVILLPGREDRDIWAYFASLAFPPEAVVRQHPRRARGRGPGPVAGRAGDPRRSEPRPPGDHAEGPRRGRRRAPGQRRLGADRPAVVLRRRTVRAGGRRAIARTAGDARLRRGRRLPDGVPAPRAGRPGRRAVRAVRQLHGAAPGGGCLGHRRGRGPGAAAPARGRCSAAPDVAVRDEGPRHRRRREDPAGGVRRPGRALGRLTDVGWGTRLRALLAADAPDEPVTADLTSALVTVLAAWDWEQRPAAVVTVASRTRPLLIESLGKRIADIGRLPYLGALAYTDGGPGPRRHNSAQRLRSLWDTFAVPGALAGPLAALDGPVLLIDDRIETGWTVTVAAKLLREAGAPAVLPLVLAVTAG